MKVTGYRVLVSTFDYSSVSAEFLIIGECATKKEANEFKRKLIEGGTDRKNITIETCRW